MDKGETAGAVFFKYTQNLQHCTLPINNAVAGIKGERALLEYNKDWTWELFVEPQ